MNLTLYATYKRLLHLTANKYSVHYTSWKNVVAHPFEGIGKPEPLKGALQGFWSCRVNDEDRIVYEVTDSAIVVHSLKGHYQ